MKGRPNPLNPRNPNIVLRVAPAPRVGNVLSEWLEENRKWLDPVVALVWLEKEHPRLMKEKQRAEDLSPAEAEQALRLVKGRLGQQRRFRHPKADFKTQRRGGAEDAEI